MKDVVLIITCFALGAFFPICFLGELLDFAIGRVKGKGIKNGPWKTHLGAGRTSTSTIEKAAIARIGLGANNSDETIYWNAFADDDGRELWSGNSYCLVFSEKPKVRYKDKGFWSITVYGNDKFLVPNQSKKYMIRSGSLAGLISDTGLSIILSRNEPSGPAPWIPLPQADENFTIAFRCYIPEEEMKTNPQSTRLPSIRKL
ncbi:MAG: DUF1214 domain-containing protein [Bacteroidales bacterium]|nr:DUF1214 domain-containing protein [Bacteroidales bacterium]